MKLGEVDFNDLTDEQLIEAITQLQSQRETLLEDHAKKKAEAKEKRVAEPKAPRAPRQPKQPAVMEDWQQDIVKGLFE